jgi:hypothetical protein
MASTGGPGTEVVNFGASPKGKMAAYAGITWNYGSGTFDDFRLYNRELSAAEALQLYNLTSSP